MTPEEQQKLYDDLKNWFIEKHGNLFLKLSNEDQQKMILGLIQSYTDKYEIEIK